MLLIFWSVNTDTNLGWQLCGWQ